MNRTNKFTCIQMQMQQSARLSSSIGQVSTKIERDTTSKLLGLFEQLGFSDVEIFESSTLVLNSMEGEESTPASKEYWETFYTEGKGTRYYEWYQFSYEDIQDVLLNFINVLSATQILQIGMNC